MHWACVNLVPPDKKKKLGHFRPNATLTYCNTYCCIVNLLLLVPLANNFSQNLSPSSLSIFARHIEYSTFTHFPLTDTPGSIQFWIECDTSATYESTGRISAALNWIQHGTSATYELGHCQWCIYKTFSGLLIGSFSIFLNCKKRMWYWAIKLGSL